MAELTREERLILASQYLEQLESGREAEADDTLRQLAKVDAGLFVGVGRLTREVHEAINEINKFMTDPRLNEITQREIPDAKERLGYVVHMTEQAANTTLSAVEASTPVVERLREQSGELVRDWQRFRAREMNVEDFRELSGRLTEFLDEVGRQSDGLHRNLSEILMAQSYQDLTGQVVKRVSQLVRDIEQKLVELVRISGKAFPGQEGPAPSAPDTGPDGPLVPGVNERGRVSSQDEVDDLLSQLGF